jgi:hypothetical protein
MTISHSSRLVVLVVMIVALPLTSALAQDLKCSHCGRVIEGPYVVFEGKNLHETCYANNYVEKCARCGDVITGPYTVYEGQSLHDRCYNDHYLSYCSICKGAIVGPFSYNSWGDTVHARHANEFPSCAYCGRLKAEPLSGRGVRYPDGRELCSACYGRAVSNMSAARAVMDTVVNTLRLHGIRIEHDFALHLVDQDEMSRANPADGMEALGYTGLEKRSAVFGLVSTSTIDVYVLSGMPRTFLAGVLAHEIMHVWLFTNAPLENDHVLNEGSCEYAAYLAIRNRPGRMTQFYLESQMASKDRVYGEGFRKVKGYVANVGVESWLGYLRLYKNPPWN